MGFGECVFLFALYYPRQENIIRFCYDSNSNTSTHEHPHRFADGYCVRCVRAVYMFPLRSTDSFITILLVIKNLSLLVFIRIVAISSISYMQDACVALVSLSAISKLAFDKQLHKTWQQRYQEQ